MVRTKIIIELEWDSSFDTTEFRKRIEELLEESPNLTAYSIEQKS